MDIEDLVASVNIAEDLDEETLTSIGHKVVEGYNADEDSRSGWLDKYEKAMEIATQVWEEKSYPWPNAANVKYPLLTIACLQFHARAYPALIPGANIVQGKVIGQDEDGSKTEAAIRIGTHMSYQLLDEMEDWESDMDRMLITLPVTGCEFKKTYFDPNYETNVSEHVFAKDLVINYYAKSLKTASRITQILDYTGNDLIELQRSGLYLDTPLGDPIPRDDQTTHIADDSQGLTKPDIDSTAPYKILEQHCYFDLDDDGYDEPYIITVEANSGTVLRIVAGYNINGVKYNDKNQVSKIERIEYFTKYDFIPNPNGGVYGMGFGTLLGPLNESVNTIINQLIDAGTLSNLQSGFISKNLRIKGGAHTFKPGEWKNVNAYGQDLANGLFPLPVREPSMVLFQLLGYLVSAGERIASTSDMMVGENPGQNQKATTTMAVLDQGMKVFTAIYKRIRKSLGKEFKKLYLVNREYLDPKAYYNIVDPVTKKTVELDINKTDYEMEKVDIIPSADPNVATQQQKQAKAQVLMELSASGILNPSNEFEYERSYRLLDSLEIPNIDTVLAPPPNPEEIPPSIEQMQMQLDAEKEANAEKEREFRRELDMAELEVKAHEAGAKLDIDQQKANTADAKAQKEATTK